MMREVVPLLVVLLVAQIAFGTVAANAAPPLNGPYPYCGGASPQCWPGSTPNCTLSYYPACGNASSSCYPTYSSYTFYYETVVRDCCVSYPPVPYWWEYPPTDTCW